MNNLVDQIIEKRTKFITKTESEVKNNLIGNLDTDFQNLIAKPLENPKGNNYLQKIHARAKHHPITWEAIEGIDEIAGISNIHHGTLEGQMSQITAAIDNYYRMLLEPIAALPYFYMDPLTNIEPNCVGASQVIASIYAFDKPLEDLEMQYVISTKRRDTLLKVLKHFDKLPSIPFFTEKDLVEANFDNFSGVYEREYLRDIILDQVLLIEDSDHIAIAQKNGEVFDYKLERDNFKKILKCPIQEGIWATGINSLINLYQYFNYPVENEWNKIKNKLEDICEPMALTLEHSLHVNKFEQLKSLYGEDLPIRYYVAQVIMSG
ncbi:MAG: hypothetical protein KC550_02900, partial [Nanoarchaeota archaeon]|nr:hypothetical protein [Nanoarchaeota archaeon]